MQRDAGIAWVDHPPELGYSARSIPLIRTHGAHGVNFNGLCTGVRADSTCEDVLDVITHLNWYAQCVSIQWR